MECWWLVERQWGLVGIGGMLVGIDGGQWASMGVDGC